MTKQEILVDNVTIEMTGPLTARLIYIDSRLPLSKKDEEEFNDHFSKYKEK